VNPRLANGDAVGVCFPIPGVVVEIPRGGGMLVHGVILQG
jgi:hypothetical protein